MIASINNYNHNWQTSFVFADDARPILPAGTAIVMRTHFDNTENNPLSIDPDQWVVFGGRSVDAMSHFHELQSGVNIIFPGPWYLNHLTRIARSSLSL